MSFVGNITAKESFDELISSTDSVLIDVRSSRELCVDNSLFICKEKEYKKHHLDKNLFLDENEFKKFLQKKLHNQ